MPIAITEVTPEKIDTNAGSATFVDSATFTPANNSLLVAFVGYRSDVVLTVTGGSLTWTKRAASEASAVGRTIEIWTAPVVTGASMAIKSSWSAAPIGWGVCYFQVTGHNVSAPVVQSSVSKFTNSGTTVPYSFASALNRNNAYMISGLLTGDETPNAVPPTGWTEIMDGGHASPNNGYWASYRVGGEAGTSYPTTVDSHTAQIVRSAGIEIADDTSWWFGA